jgi:hypothetical protein
MRIIDVIPEMIDDLGNWWKAGDASQYHHAPRWRTTDSPLGFESLNLHPKDLHLPFLDH